MEKRLFANAVPEIDRVALQDKLISFASNYKDLKKGLLENMNDNENDSDSLQSEKEYTEVPESSAKTTCCLKKDIAMKIKSNKDKTIDKIAESSVEMSTMLLL